MAAWIQLPGNRRRLKMLLSPGTVVERIFTNVSLKAKAQLLRRTEKPTDATAQPRDKRRTKFTRETGMICMIARIARDRGSLLSRLDKQEKLRGGASKSRGIDLRGSRVPKFFFGAFPRAPRLTPSPGRAYFCNIFREPRRPHPPPLFLDFAPRKPYFSFNFISNLESSDSKVART